MHRQLYSQTWDRDPKIVAVVGKWSLYRGHLCYKSSKKDHAIRRVWLYLKKSDIDSLLPFCQKKLRNIWQKMKTTFFVNANWDLKLQTKFHLKKKVMTSKDENFANQQGVNPINEMKASKILNKPHYAISSVIYLNLYHVPKLMNKYSNKNK